MSSLSLRFWGVRGSICSSSSRTLQVGGNTSCVEVRAGQTRIVLDAGTGLRGLGATVEGVRGPHNFHLLISHFHWDHIQGFPFFTPAYVPGNRIDIYGPERCVRGGDIQAAFSAQMSAPHLPVPLEAMGAEKRFHSVPAGARFQIDDVRVIAAPAQHPGGCLAYRLEYDGHSIVYATDTEHDARTGALDPTLVELARGADVLIYDAQYTAEEYAGGGGKPARRGWGHSTAGEGARIANEAGVGKLILYHHDPAHDDWEIARIEAETRNAFGATEAAREGLEVRL